MTTWCVLLRGVNVGGKNLIPMKMLTQGLNEVGCEDVISYIQSGNLVFSHSTKDSKVVAELVAGYIQQAFDCSVQVLALDLAEFSLAVNNSPFGEQERKSTHWFFLSKECKGVDLSLLDSLKKSTESYKLIDKVFYLHAPEGIGRSKLVAKLEKFMGVPVTARNGNTVHKLWAMLQRAK